MIMGDSKPVDGCGNSGAIIFFSTPLVNKLSLPEGRLEPTYIGVRRIRPSSKIVKDVLQNTNKSKKRHERDDSGNGDGVTGVAREEEEKCERTTKEEVEEIHCHHHAVSNNQSSSSVTFKVKGEDGVERRMTKQEKKALKISIAQQKKREKEQRRLEREGQNETPKKKKKKDNRKRKKKDMEEALRKDDERMNDAVTASVAKGGTEENNGEDDDNDDEDLIGEALAKVGLPPPKRTLIEQEIADLKGERQGVPPVIVQAALAQAALNTPGLLLPRNPSNTCPKDNNNNNNNSIWIDDELAQEWSNAITESMVPCLEVRGREDMRSMAYNIAPEPWKRLRPDTIPPKGEFKLRNNNNDDDDDDNQTDATTGGSSRSRAECHQQPTTHDEKRHDNNNNNNKKDMASDSANKSSILSTNDDHGGGDGEPWAIITIRPPTIASSTFDSDMAIVAQILHRYTTLYISCGSKFGCDFLVYDGPRRDRHAFAGLRVITSETNNNNNNNNRNTNNTKASSSSHAATVSTSTTTTTTEEEEEKRTLPVPSPYGMAGYVRCLNTAGKLALIATVKRQKQEDGSLICRVAFVDLKLERVDGTKRKNLDDRLEKLHRHTDRQD